MLNPTVSARSAAKRAERRLVPVDTLERLRRENETLRRAVLKLKSYQILAFRDPLTEIGNRRFFEKQLAVELRNIQRGSSNALSVLAIDLNNLKDVNDSDGHAAGDEVLRWVGKFLQENLRTEDICCRTGGDEFMVILVDTDATQCQRLVNRLRESLSEANRNRDSNIGLSVGAASFGADNCCTAEDLVAEADRAMYLDKRLQKRGRSIRYIPSQAVSQ